jgi:ubiquinone/menaquinone biosynthesis C-methylase UbiE
MTGGKGDVGFMKGTEKPMGAGGGTFALIDRDRFMGELGLRESMAVLDIGCGRGDYSLAMAEAVGPRGYVYALDAWDEGLDILKGRARDLGLGNIGTLRADVNDAIPLADASVDVCLMATVLHDLLREGTGEVTLKETARVLRPGGTLVIVEFMKVDQPPGPPVHVRLSAAQVEETIRPFGFVVERVRDVGPGHYLLIASPA